jgi:hypothetical protein
MFRQILIILILIATLGYATFTYWPVISPLVALVHLPTQKRSAPAAPVPPPTAAPKISTTMEAAVKNASVMEMVLPKAKANLVDPFSLRVAVKTIAEEPVTTTTLAIAKPVVVRPAGPELQGVWLESGMSLAFISDQSVQLGGTIMGWKLVSITPDHVVLKKGSATKILKLEGK